MGYITELRKKVGNMPLIMVGAAVILVRGPFILLQLRTDNEC
ncbi:NUDIX hydrolase [Bacillus testis]